MSRRLVINDRVATEAEAKAGEVIFYIPDHRSVPFSFGKLLPLEAVVTKPKGDDDFPPPGTILTIVQAERVDDNVVLGFENGEEEGICMLDDVQMQEFARTDQGNTGGKA